jgi:hypothetical protein
MHCPLAGTCVVCVRVAVFHIRSLQRRRFPWRYPYSIRGAGARLGLGWKIEVRKMSARGFCHAWQEIKPKDIK